MFGLFSLFFIFMLLKAELYICVLLSVFSKEKALSRLLAISFGLFYRFCTKILSKEQLRDQLVDRLGCREEETEIVVALSSGLVGSYLREEHLTWGGSWTWHLSCHSTARGPQDPLPRLAVSPFHVWPVPFLQIQFSSPAAFWCQLLHRLDIESDSGLNQLVVCVLQSPLSMTLVHSTSQRCLWHTRT